MKFQSMTGGLILSLILMGAAVAQDTQPAARRKPSRPQWQAQRQASRKTSFAEGFGR